MYAMFSKLLTNKVIIVKYELPDDILDFLVEDEAVYHHDVRHQGDDLHLKQVGLHQEI